MSMKIFAKDLSNNVYTLYADSSDTVLDIYNHLVRLTGICFTHTTVKYKGKYLPVRKQDEYGNFTKLPTLEETGIEDGCTIYLRYDNMTGKDTSCASTPNCIKSAPIPGSPEVAVQGECTLPGCTIGK